MKSYPGLILACLLLIGLSLACERTQSVYDNEVNFSEALPKIPASYGSLEAITTVPQYPGWFQLWFEDDIGTIRIVRVQIFSNEMPPEVKTIERTQPMVEEVVEDEG